MYNCMLLYSTLTSCADPEGGQGVRIKSYRVSWHYWLGIPENHKDTKPAFKLGHHRHNSQMPFKWRFTGGPIMACLSWYLDPTSAYY